MTPDAFNFSDGKGLRRQWQPFRIWVGTPYEPREGDWVTLRDRTPSEEALLLCPEDEDRWLAWVPECGEQYLDERQFFVSRSLVFTAADGEG